MCSGHRYSESIPHVSKNVREEYSWVVKFLASCLFIRRGFGRPQVWSGYAKAERRNWRRAQMIEYGERFTRKQITRVTQRRRGGGKRQNCVTV